MNMSQAHLLSLLTLSINGGVPSYEELESISSEELFNLALQQDVYSLLYFTLNKHQEELKLDGQIMRRWKEATLYMATKQASMVNQIKTILGIFESNGITVISIKGLVLKQLYPQPELRNMSDIDLLINEKDIQKSIELLSKYGYHPSPKDLNNPRYMHIGMKKPGAFSIELHRTLWHPTIMKTKDEEDQIWLNHIWQNIRLVTMEGLQFQALSPEDELINLVVHLARHVMESDAQIRQLCDFVLFVKFYWNNLNLKYINQIIKSMDLYTFYQNVIITCYVYFGLIIIPINFNIRNKYISEILINLIYSAPIDNKAINKSKFRRTTSSNNYNTFARYIKFLLPLNSGLDIGLEIIRRITVILKRNPFIARTVKFLKCYKGRAHCLRIIGLYIRY